jgi:hypothetical protein
MKTLFTTIIFMFAVSLTLMSFPSPGSAQMLGMGMPYPTTLVITKPAPDQNFGDKQVVTMGVNGKTYKFLLKDAYVDDRKVHWPDIWEQVRQYRPNFKVVGTGEDTFAKMQPGQTVTIKGMYAPLTQNFEVNNVEEGAGQFAPASHY